MVGFDSLARSIEVEVSGGWARSVVLVGFLLGRKWWVDMGFLGPKVVDRLGPLVVLVGFSRFAGGG